MKNVQKHGGIVFFIIKFTVLDRYFIVPYARFESFWERMQSGGRKSITLLSLKKPQWKLLREYNPRINYLDAVSTIGVGAQKKIRLKGRKQI